MSDPVLSVYLEFEDGTIKNLPDISYEKFEDLLFVSGGSDTEWDKYLRENKFHEIMSFNDSLFRATLIFQDNVYGRVLKFKLSSDTEYEKAIIDI